ncbi:unnamed protein product [Hapterophycus canaliculatus]
MSALASEAMTPKPLRASMAMRACDHAAFIIVAHKERMHERRFSRIQRRANDVLSMPMCIRVCACISSRVQLFLCFGQAGLASIPAGSPSHYVHLSVVTENENVWVAHDHLVRHTVV